MPAIRNLPPWKSRKLSSRGQVVIPKGVREQAHLVEGMEFTIVFEAGEIKLRAVSGIQPSTHAQAAGSLSRPDRRATSEAETSTAVAALIQTHDDATNA